MSNVSVAMVDDLLRPVLLKDLRTICRAKGLNPGGSREALAERVKEYILQTGDLNLSSEGVCAPPPVSTTVGSPGRRTPLTDQTAGNVVNNYVRPEGQNVGNFITGRPSSRVLAPPGGGSSIFLG